VVARRRCCLRARDPLARDRDRPVRLAGAAHRKRQKARPRSSDGRSTRRRWAAAQATQPLFYGLPWLGRGGRPAVLFDPEARHFFVLAAVLRPRDLIPLAWLTSR
jgi:hypothetical protein